MPGDQVKRFEKELGEDFLYDLLRNEVRVYDAYLTGEQYYYTTYTPEGSEIDSCCGYSGSDHEKSGLLAAARDSIDSHISQNDSGVEQLEFNFKGA